MRAALGGRLNWFEARDNYCERLDPSFWAEPLNALTNLFFIYFAIVIFIKNKNAKSDPQTRFELNVLSALLFLIGVGSLSFHTFANRLTEIFDVLGIILFVIAYLYFVLQRAFSYSRLVTVSIVAALLATTIIFSAVVPDSLFNGSHIYFPVLALFFWIVMKLKKQKSKYFPFARTAMIVFFISIVFRTLDSLVCDIVPIGTHFLWHTLNACAFYILLKDYRASH